jgi:hypothetical protein
MSFEHAFNTRHRSYGIQWTERTGGPDWAAGDDSADSCKVMYDLLADSDHENRLPPQDEIQTDQRESWVMLLVRDLSGKAASRARSGSPTGREDRRGWS